MYFIGSYGYKCSNCGVEVLVTEKDFAKDYIFINNFLLLIIKNSLILIKVYFYEKNLNEKYIRNNLNCYEDWENAIDVYFENRYETIKLKSNQLLLNDRKSLIKADKKLIDLDKKSMKKITFI